MCKLNRFSRTNVLNYPFDKTKRRSTLQQLHCIPPFSYIVKPSPKIPLIGIELNPGPPKKSNLKKQIKKVANAPKKKSQPANKPSGSLGRTLLKGAGTALGGLLGFPSVGSSVGNFVSDIVGLGEYKVNSNSLMRSSNSIPSFTHSEDSIVVSHREYICDVNSSIDFRSTSYNITPSNAQLFPWLEPMSKQYEQYEFQGLVFAFNSTSGQAIASTNNALGTVILATEYDVSRPPFSSKSMMENYEYSTSAPPSSPMLHPIECNPKLDIVNSRYLNGPFRLPDTLDDNIAENLKILGRLQLATQGMQADNINVGELWATYKVKFMKPRIQAPSNFLGKLHYSSSSEGFPTIIGTSVPITPNLNIVDDSTSSLQSVKIRNVTGAYPGPVIDFSGVAPGTRFKITCLAVCDIPESHIYFSVGGAVSHNIQISGTLFANGTTGQGSFNMHNVNSLSKAVDIAEFQLLSGNYTDPALYSLPNLLCVSSGSPVAPTARVDIELSVIPQDQNDISNYLSPSDQILSLTNRLNKFESLFKLNQLDYSRPPSPSRTPSISNPPRISRGWVTG